MRGRKDGEAVWNKSLYGQALVPDGEKEGSSHVTGLIRIELGRLAA